MACEALMLLAMTTSTSTVLKYEKPSPSEYEPIALVTPPRPAAPGKPESSLFGSLKRIVFIPSVPVRPLFPVFTVGPL